MRGEALKLPRVFLIFDTGKNFKNAEGLDVSGQTLAGRMLLIFGHEGT